MEDSLPVFFQAYVSSRSPLSSSKSPLSSSRGTCCEHIVSTTELTSKQFCSIYCIRTELYSLHKPFSAQRAHRRSLCASLQALNENQKTSAVEKSVQLGKFYYSFFSLFLRQSTDNLSQKFELLLIISVFQLSQLNQKPQQIPSADVINSLTDFTFQSLYGRKYFLSRKRLLV